MQPIIDNVLPVFGLIAIGYACVRAGLLRLDIGDGLGEFVFTVAIPVLVFRTLAYADFDGASPWGLWAAYFSALALVGVAGGVLAMAGFGRDLRAGIVAAFSCGFSNMVLIGIPLVERTLGDAGTVALLVILSVHLPVAMTATAILIAIAEEGGKRRSMGAVLRRTLGAIVLNPIILAIIAAIAFRVSGLGLPSLAASLVDSIAAIAGPTALIALGASLVRYGIARNIGTALAFTAMKLAVLPALVWAGVTFVFTLPPVWSAALVLTAALPTGVNAYLIANRLGTGHALASNTVLLSTLGGVVTVSLWIAALGI